MALAKIHSAYKDIPKASTFVGEIGNIFYDVDTGILRLSDGVTPGGILIYPGGTGTAIVDYQNTQPSGPANGQLWYNPDTDILAVYDAGTWITTGGSLNDIDGINTTNNQTGDVLVYNGATLDYENISINLNGGIDNQILVKQSGTDYDYRWEDLIVDVDPAYTKLLDDDNPLLWYLGEAVPNSAEANAVWRIQRIQFDASGNVEEVRYAASGEFDQVWNLRLGLTYI